MNYIVGQQDDARMCLAIAMTATRYGATVANHVKVEKHGFLTINCMTTYPKLGPKGYIFTKELEKMYF